MDVEKYEQYIVDRLLIKKKIGKNKYTNIDNIRGGIPDHLWDKTMINKAIKNLRNQLIVSLTKKDTCIFINQKELRKAKEIANKWRKSVF